MKILPSTYISKNCSSQKEELSILRKVVDFVCGTSLAEVQLALHYKKLDKQVKKELSRLKTKRNGK